MCDDSLKGSIRDDEFNTWFKTQCHTSSNCDGVSGELNIGFILDSSSLFTLKHP